ncbi:MAG: AI-2E family transporter [Candidatus Thermoplasmatota archaeon]|nr:AI-2E family transporter [Candidatus Thermoplasmatota archaeon]MEC8681823.1 AI-2E family transporter [Candidatus Thermoplasmatota archaeon]MEE2974094.1 AI-2E family transporter [Candidatus Thermoplasmatota archaeon]
MDVNAKIGIDSKRTTAASVAIVGVVVYLALVHLKPILMPLAMAVLLYFLIKPPEQYIHAKVGNRFVSYGTVILTFIITMYFLSIFLYEQLSLFVEDVPEITAALEEKRAKYAASDLYGLEIIFSDSTWVEVLASPSNIETFVLAILGSLGAFVGTMVTVLIFLLFIVLEEHTIAKRFRAAFPASTGRAGNIVRDSTESISAYVVSKVTCSGGQAIVMTLILSPVGFNIPGWFLFGVLCFLLDFIPILGALFATIPPVLIGFIMMEPLTAVFMLALLIGNQQVFGSLVEPNLSGAKIGISPLVLLLTVMLFSQVWGIAGAIIGAPMIIMIRLILEENERTRPVAVMMANDVEEE